MTATLPLQLPAFEGESVSGAKVKIVGAGDGLSEALKVTPEALHIDDEVFYVLRGTVTQISHVSKDDEVTRVHTVKAGAITKVDADLATRMLADAADALERAKAEAQGQLLLDAENDALAKEADD
jgi:hypothetical protein